MILSESQGFAVCSPYCARLDDSKVVGNVFVAQSGSFASKSARKLLRVNISAGNALASICGNGQSSGLGSPGHVTQGGIDVLGWMVK